MTPAAMVTVNPAGQWLNPQAADSLARMVAAGCPVNATSAGRTAAEQQHLIELHHDHPTTYAWAAPVDESEHVTGNAVDVSSAMGAWMLAHPGYGWVRTALPDEPWHWAYRPTYDAHRPAPPAPTREDYDMASFTASGPDGQVWHCSGVLKRPISRAQADALTHLAAPATVPYLGGIAAEQLAGFADIGGLTRPITQEQQ